MSESVSLRRTLSLTMAVFYGLGTILGAGIYVLVGEVAGSAGTAAPFAFLLAAVVAGFSALAYAELAARLPRCAGSAVYVHAAFGSRLLATATGLAVVAIGVVTCATLVQGGVGYLRLFVALPEGAAVLLVLLVLGALAAWGIREAAWVAVISTVVELSGLVLVSGTGGDALAQLPQRWPELIPSTTAWPGIGTAAFIAFFAFIGFEDIVTASEEVRDAQRNVPRAILLALGLATLCYLVVATVAVLSVPVAELSASAAPLALVYQHNTGQPPLFIGLVGVAAVVNGILIMLLVASRVLYGMARDGWLPPWLAVVYPSTRTPLHATLLVVGLVALLALWLPLITLAKATSAITLLVFILVNLALWRLKRAIPQPAGIRVYPRWIPVLGFICCCGLLLLEGVRVMAG